MKKSISILLFMLCACIGHAQNYVKLSDASGVQVSAGELVELEAAATALKNTLPVGVRDSFNVYDAGLYLYNGHIDGGVDGMFKEVVGQIGSKYYLVFGKYTFATTNQLKIKVDFKLPTYGIFECFDLISLTYRESIKSELEANVNIGLSQVSIVENESSAMSLLKNIIVNKLCCDIGNRTPGACDKCMAFDTTNVSGITYYPSSTIVQELIENEFALESVKILSDNEYYIPSNNPAFRNSNPADIRSVLNMNATVQFHDDNTETVDNLISGLQADLGYPTIYKFKYPRDCGDFENVFEAYKNDRGNAIFIVLVNVNRSEGFLAYKYKTAGSPNRARSNTLTEEDLEGLTEAKAELEGSCGKAIFALGDRSYYYIDYAMNKVFLSKKEQKFYAELYKYKEQNSRANLTESQRQLGNYYDIEYIIEKKKNKRFDWTAALHAGYNVCSGEIHGILDVCGVIEPLGVVCDATNSILYGLSGDGKNCALSAVSVIPAIGLGAAAYKAGGKIVKTTWSSVKYQVKFSYKVSTNGVKWIGGYGKLKKVFIKVGNNMPFNGIKYDPLDNPVHHLIPWNLTDEAYTAGKKFTTGQINKLAKAGWHPSDIDLNGFIIPEKLSNGKNFHVIESGFGHPSYTSKVYDEAIKIIDNTSIENIEHEMIIFTNKLREHMQMAYKKSKNLNEYFSTLKSI